MKSKLGHHQILHARLTKTEHKLAEAEHKLAEVQKVIQVNQSGDVDALVVSSRNGDKLFTLRGADYDYSALVAMSKSNQLLVRAEDEPEFLRQVCRIIHEDCGHAMVWIGMAQEDEAKTVLPVAQGSAHETEKIVR